MGAEVVVPSTDLSLDIDLLANNGFTLDVIFPADEPRVARMTGFGLRLRLDAAATAAPPTVTIDASGKEFVSSAGASFVFESNEFAMPSLDDRLVFTNGGEWGAGRAGMQYRDLIPDRHGGRVIASHIRIPEPGIVPDYVHHHDIRFQMIYCRRGTVKVIYEDQGDAFWMTAGDCVLQPPHIRHRVLASDDGCEVVEITSPAEHPTFVEHEVELPTDTVRPDRDFGGQRFSFDRGDDLSWEAAGSGWEQRATGIGRATDGLASVRVLRGGDGASLTGSHSGDLCLFFVLEGSAILVAEGAEQALSIDDSVAVKSGTTWALTRPENSFTALHIELEGDE